MTHTTVSLEPESYGSQDAYLHQINITSLDAAGQENYNPSTELNVNLGDDYGVLPVGQSNETHTYTWNVSGEHLNVKTTSDGADVANNDNVGEVRLLVVGGGT